MAPRGRTPGDGELSQRRGEFPSAAPPVHAERQPVSAAPRGDRGVHAAATRRPASAQRPGERITVTALGRAAQPGDGLEDVRPVPPRGHRRRGRQVGTDRADLPGDGQLRRRRRDGGGPGQHPVLRGGLRGEQEQGRAVPADHHRAVRGHRAADRSGAGPAAARPPRRAGDLVRAAHRAWRWCSSPTTTAPPAASRPGCCIRARWE